MQTKNSVRESDVRSVQFAPSVNESDSSLVRAQLQTGSRAVRVL